MANKLQKLRSHLSAQGTDLQRAYQFTMTSFLLKIFKSDIYITDVDHPVFQYENLGDYKASIVGKKKPSDMSITFLEDDLLSVGGMLDTWDELKYSTKNGVLFPKSVYEDVAILTYHSKIQTGNGLNAAGSYVRAVDQVGKNVLGGVQDAAAGLSQGQAPSADNFSELLQKNKRYMLSGFYPINRTPISLSYGSNDVVRIQVNFNVDKIETL
jgi:hypothetical protein